MTAAQAAQDVTVRASASRLLADRRADRRSTRSSSS